MAVVSLATVRQILTNYLNDMGLSPHNLRITEYDSEKITKNWYLKGEFEDGFLGSMTFFESYFHYEDNTISMFRITGKAGTQV